MQLDLLGHKEKEKKPSPKAPPKAPPKLHHLYGLQGASEELLRKARPYRIVKLAPNKTFIENL